MKTVLIQYKPHPGQRAFHADPSRFRVMTCGRRWGKTKAACAEAIRRAVEVTKAVVWWIAPTYSMANIGWRQIHELLPTTLTKQVNISERYIELPNLSRIWVKSADNPDSLRGEGLDLAILDEAAFIKEDAWTAAIRPALADKQGRAVFISTPLGRNWFWRIFLQGQGEDAEWKSWTFQTADNPYIPGTEVDAAKRDMPERIFRQEFMAEFVEDAGSVMRKVMEAATATPGTAQRTVFGVDWGKLSDFTCITVLDADTGAMVDFDRFNQIDYAVQVGRLKALAQRHNPQLILAERNSMGEPLVEMLQRENLPVEGFQTTQQSKAQIIEALALAFERGEVRIFGEPVLTNELQAFEMERLPSGAMRYQAPTGLHDDCVISLALAWWARGSSLTGQLFY